MKQIDELSAVGFGTYRLRLNEIEHSASLNDALDYGCNLIDTAPTYGNGEAEQLIGNILQERKSEHFFVITKAGYINEFVRRQLHEADLYDKLPDTISIGDNEFHSIHPDFIRFQMTGSEKRLHRRIDGFLLHNPEYHLSLIDDGEDEYLKKLKLAFEFLEEQVTRGRISYYGVSSNELSFGTYYGKKTGLQYLLRIAEEISSNHHFKLVQFPFNIFENQATQYTAGNKSLIEMAKDFSILTFSNRPLNSNHNNHSLRLAFYTLQEDEINEVKGQEVIDRFINLVGNHLYSIGVHEDVFDFIPLQVLHTNWNFFENTDTVDAFMYRHLMPFLQKAFEDDFSAHLKNCINEVYLLLVNHSRRRMNENSQQISQLFQMAGIPKEADQSLSNVAVTYCLKSGIDHVLVGMKRRQYVDDLKNLFQYETNSISSFV